MRGVTLCLPGCTSDDQCPTAGFCDQDTGDCTTDDEDCTDGTDNDGDQRADCEEFDCVADPACTEAYDTVCAEAVAATATTIGDNRDGTQVFSGSCVGVGGAHESLHTFSPGEPGQEGFLALQLSSSPDLGLYVRSACETMESELGCVDRAPGGGNEGLTVAVTGGEVPNQCGRE